MLSKNIYSYFSSRGKGHHNTNVEQRKQKFSVIHGASFPRIIFHKNVPMGVTIFLDSFYHLFYLIFNHIFQSLTKSLSQSLADFPVSSQI